MIATLTGHRLWSALRINRNLPYRWTVPKFRHRMMGMTKTPLEVVRAILDNPTDLASVEKLVVPDAPMCH